jgi:hypothetical protein
VSDGIGLSRGDRNRNARLARLRQLLPLDHAIVGIDLADAKQAAVVAQEQAAHRPAVLSPSVQSIMRNLDIEPHNVAGGVPVVDARLHAGGRCHGPIVEKLPGGLNGQQGA